MPQFRRVSSVRAIALVGVWLLFSVWAHAGATITIVNANAEGVGFNDPTPATPVGGNTGTTVGAQRLIAFQYAAAIWGATLDSTVEIRVSAQFSALSCTANSGTLGSAGAINIVRDFSGAPFATTWYPIALANKLAGSDLIGANNDINANFNSNVGTTGCLESATWYYGLDNNHTSAQVNLVAVVLHELGHGLGFSLGGCTLDTGICSGNPPSPTIYSRFLFDKTVGKSWHQMTDGERATSATNTNNVVWTGAEVVSKTSTVLGTPFLQITAPPAIAGNFAAGGANFGPRLTSAGVSAQLAIAQDGSGNPTLACSAITNGASITGKIAVVDRGNCNFTVKVKNAQDVGAVGVIVVENTADPVSPLGGWDAAVTIPAVRVTQADGNTIKNQIGLGTVSGKLAMNFSQPQGADNEMRPLMYTPNPLEGGSSISHFDTSAFPNQLMEPSVNDDLTHSVKAPQDLTRALFTDIGWGAETTGPPAAPVAVFLPFPLAFGNKLLGYGTFTGSVKLSNTGNADMTVSSISLSGNAAYARSHDCPGTLAAGAFCTIAVTYLPPGTGLHSATLTVNTNAAGSPHTVNVSGTGVNDLAFTLTRPVRPPRAGTGSANVFELTITPGTGFSGLVALSCDAGAGLRCAVAPGQVRIVDATTTARVTVEPSRSLRLRRASQAEPRLVRLRVVVEGRVRVVELPFAIGR